MGSLTAVANSESDDDKTHDYTAALDITVPSPVEQIEQHIPETATESFDGFLGFGMVEKFALAGVILAMVVGYARYRARSRVTNDKSFA